MQTNVLYTVLLLFLSVQAQQVKVLNKDNKMPITGVAIYNITKDKATITDFDGMASLDQFSLNELIYFSEISHYTKSINKNELKDNDYVIYLESKAEDLDEVILSASKFKQVKTEVSHQIINIDSKAIEFNTPQTSADLVEHSGNVYVQKSQLGGGSPIIRGFSTNRLLITVDGIRMNNAIFRGGNLHNIISIDPLSIQSSEVTLGMGSVIYGSDAIGGVMSFYTKKPRLSYKDSIHFYTNAIARYSTASREQTGHFDVNIGLKKWGALSSVSFNKFEDLRMGSKGPDDYLRREYVITNNGKDRIVSNPNVLKQTPSGFSQINILQNFSYKPRDDVGFDFGIQFSETSNYSRYDRLIRYNDGNLHTAEWNYGPQRWLMTRFNFTKDKSNSVFYDKIQTNLAYQSHHESRFTRDFQSTVRNIRKERVNVISGSLNFEKDIFKKTELYYGLDYVYNYLYSKGFEEHIDTKTITSDVSRYPNASSWESAAIYTSIKYIPNPELAIQIGGRYNHVFINADFKENNQYLNLPFNSTYITTGALTGLFGINWNPSPMLQWRLNISSAFRAPNIDDIGKVFDSEPGAVVVPNPNLKPEYAYGVELGSVLKFKNFATLDLSSYYTFLDHALVRRDFQINGSTSILYDGELSTVQAIQNASKSRIYGFEVGLRINVSKKLKLVSQYNVIGGSEIENNIKTPVRHVVPNFGKTHLIWKSDKLLVDAFIVYNNELSFSQLSKTESSKPHIYALDNNGNPYAPSWYTLNLKTQYQLNHKLQFSVGLENITDRRYKTYSSGIAASGRNLILSLKYTLE